MSFLVGLRRASLALWKAKYSQSGPDYRCHCCSGHRLIHMGPKQRKRCTERAARLPAILVAPSDLAADSTPESALNIPARLRSTVHGWSPPWVPGSLHHPLSARCPMHARWVLQHSSGTLQTRPAVARKRHRSRSRVSDSSIDPARCRVRPLEPSRTRCGDPVRGFPTCISDAAPASALR